jgi:hypothetical protein
LPSPILPAQEDRQRSVIEYTPGVSIYDWGDFVDNIRQPVALILFAQAGRIDVNDLIVHEYAGWSIRIRPDHRTRQMPRSEAAIVTLSLRLIPLETDNGDYLAIAHAVLDLPEMSGGETLAGNSWDRELPDADTHERRAEHNHTGGGLRSLKPRWCQ